jgi:di/tricarboxylate transporter
MSDILQDAKSELSGMAKQGMHHPSTKPVLTAAAVGAVAGAVLPLVTWPAGLVIGAGYMFFKRLRP